MSTRHGNESSTFADSHDEDELDNDMERGQDRSIGNSFVNVTRTSAEVLSNRRISRSIGHARSAVVETWSREDREELQDENRRLIEDVGRLRTWRDRLQREKADAQAANRRSDAEVDRLKQQLSDERSTVKRLQGSYMALMDEKVALAERLAGPAKLPLEILLNIAGFIAGDNNYGTLLSFCLMSKRIKEETKSTFYETVLVYDIVRLRREAGSSRHLDAYRFTKFVYTWKFRAFLLLQKCFPNVHAIILLRKDSHDDMPPSHRGENYTPFKASVWIHGPVRSDTLFSILRYPVSWDISMPAEYHSINAVSSVVLIDEGALIGEDPPVQDLYFQNLICHCVVNIANCSGHERTVECLRELDRFVPSLLGRQGKRPVLDLVVRLGPALDAFFIQLPGIARRHPHLRLDISIVSDASPTGAWFRDQCMIAAAAYGSVWQDIESQGGHYRPPALEEDYFFSLTSDTVGGAIRSQHDGPGDVSGSVAKFSYTRATDSFRIEILQYDSNGDDDEEITVYDQPYVIEGAQIQE